MDIKSGQRVLLRAGYYSGGIDGDIGTLTLKAANTLIEKHANLLTSNPSRWSASRRLIAAVQIVLHFAGYQPGAVDGLAGHNTLNALRAWEYAQLGGRPEIIPQTPLPGAPDVKPVWPKQADCPTFYGKALSAEIERKMVTIESPYAMRLDYSLGTTTRKIRLHEKCADSALRVLHRVHDAYGYQKLRDLGLDRYAGAFMPRNMRGSDKPSMHAYGCAIDWYAGPNGLTTRCPKALFCGTQYTKFFDLWADEGWVSLGRAIGRDWMHVQAARL